MMSAGMVVSVLGHDVLCRARKLWMFHPYRNLAAVFISVPPVPRLHHAHRGVGGKGAREQRDWHFGGRLLRVCRFSGPNRQAVVVDFHVSAVPLTRTLRLPGHSPSSTSWARAAPSGPATAAARTRRTSTASCRVGARDVRGTGCAWDHGARDVRGTGCAWRGAPAGASWGCSQGEQGEGPGGGLRGALGQAPRPYLCKTAGVQ